MRFFANLTIISLPLLVLSLPSLQTDDKDTTLNTPALNALELEARGDCWFGKPIGCSKSGYCWSVCSESDGNWCWLARDRGNGPWESCSDDEHCVNVWTKGLIECALGNCKDCGCKCW